MSRLPQPLIVTYSVISAMHGRLALSMKVNESEAWLGEYHCYSHTYWSTLTPGQHGIKKIMQVFF